MTPSTNKMGCNCSEMQSFLWLAATCYFVLIVSALSDSAEDATARQKMKIFQGVPCSEASGVVVAQWSKFLHQSLKRGWTHLCICVQSAKHPLMFFILIQKRCHWGNSERAENTKSTSFEKISSGELGNFRPVLLGIKCLPYMTALNVLVFSWFSVWQ